VNADEMTTVAANHREAGLVGPFVQDLHADLAQVGRLGPCEQQWRVILPVGPSDISVFWGRLPCNSSVSVGSCHATPPRLSSHSAIDRAYVQIAAPEFDRTFSALAMALARHCAEKGIVEVGSHYSMSFAPVQKHIAILEWAGLVFTERLSSNWPSPIGAASIGRFDTSWRAASAGRQPRLRRSYRLFLGSRRHYAAGCRHPGRRLLSISIALTANFWQGFARGVDGQPLGSNPGDQPRREATAKPLQKPILNSWRPRAVGGVRDHPLKVAIAYSRLRESANASGWLRFSGPSLCCAVV